MHSLEELKEMATLQMRVFNKDTPVPFKAYFYNSDGTVTFPRFMTLQTGVKACTAHWEVAPIAWRTERTLDPNRQQDEAVEKVLQSVSTRGGALLCLPCGYGKTTCTCVMIGRLARRAFVMVNTNELGNQWIRELRAVLPECQVSQAPEMSGNVVVGTFQLVTRGGLNVQDFDVLVVDEAHHVPAGTFCHAVSLFRRDVATIGLTATPRRRDGLEKLIEWTLGPLAFSITREDLVRQGKTPPGDYLVRTVRAPPRTNDRPMPKKYEKFPLVYWRTLLSACNMRNALLVNEIVHMVTKEYRSVLVLTLLRSHATLLVKMLQQQGVLSELLLGGARKTSKSARARKRTRKEVDTETTMQVNNKIETGHDETPQLTTTLCASSINGDSQRRCIVATAQLVGEGFDVAELDGLVIALPCSDIEQLVGRVMRQHPDKVWPVRVIDVLDNNAHEIVTALYWKRRHQMTKIFGEKGFFEMQS